MSCLKSLTLSSVLILGIGSAAQSDPLFIVRELFRIPFGEQREALGTRIENGNFQFPRDFTIDNTGRFYIYDKLKHRIARYSPVGTYEIGFTYPSTADQVFARPDSQANLWLLISDPVRGMYYGIYDPRGKKIRDGVFNQYNQFRLHLGDDAVLNVLASSRKKPGPETVYIFHEPSLLLKRLAMPPPPEDHHRLHREDRTYFIDAIPGSTTNGATKRHRVTNDSQQTVGEIQGEVLYITSRGEIYTRVGQCAIYVYDLDGTLKGKGALTGLPSACASLRFDAEGNIYELDGIPDDQGQYSEQMTGMRILRWQRP